MNIKKGTLYEVYVLFKRWNIFCAMNLLGADNSHKIACIDTENLQTFDIKNPFSLEAQGLARVVRLIQSGELSPSKMLKDAKIPLSLKKRLAPLFLVLNSNQFKESKGGYTEYVSFEPVTYIQPGTDKKVIMFNEYREPKKIFNQRKYFRIIETLAKSLIKDSKLMEALLILASPLQRKDLLKYYELPSQVINYGNDQALKVLLDLGMSPNFAHSVLNRYLLYDATSAGNYGAVKLLLDKGADIDPLDFFGLKALDVAKEKAIKNPKLYADIVWLLENYQPKN